MNRLLVCVCISFLLFVGASAQEQVPTIKGHHLGETVMEFLRVENAAPKLSQCHDLLADPKTPKRSQKEMLLKLQVDDCMNIANVLQTGDGEIGAGQLNMTPAGHSTFEHGKLIKMELDFWNLPGKTYSFDSVLSDFSTKFGDPSRTWSDDFQNGFGARFSYRRAAWKTKDLVISLAELQDDSTTAIVEDRAHAEQSARDAEARHKNALDR
jgi:hypothetical protein